MAASSAIARRAFGTTAYWHTLQRTTSTTDYWYTLQQTTKTASSWPDGDAPLGNMPST